MKALSVKNPYAFLLVNGRKTVEVRSWPTSYRGDLLICASASPADVFVEFEDGGVERIPSGCMMGIVRVVGCRKMVKGDEDEAWVKFDPLAWSWLIEPVGFVAPDQIKGRLGIYETGIERPEIIGDGFDFWGYQKSSKMFDAKKHGLLRI